MNDVRRLAVTDTQDEVSTQSSIEKGFLQFEIRTANSGPEETGNVIRILPTYSEDMIFQDDFSFDMAVSSDDLESAAGFEDFDVQSDQRMAALLRGIQQLNICGDRSHLYTHQEMRQGKGKKQKKLLLPLSKGDQIPHRRRKDSKENFKGVKRFFLGKPKKKKMSF